MNLEQLGRTNIYVTSDNLKVILKKQKEHNAYMSECLQKQIDVNKAIDSNIDKLLETQENLYEISLDLNENDADLEKRFRDFIVHQEIAAIVETIVAAILAVFLLINTIRVETLEKKVAQYEQDKTIVLEDDSSELVGDKV